MKIGMRVFLGLIIMAVGGVPFDLADNQTKQKVDSDSKAIALLRRLGGTATKQDAFGRTSKGWLIDLSDAKVKKDHWRQLAEIKWVSRLWFCDSEIGDDGLLWIGKLKGLEMLSLEGSKFDASKLKYLKNLSPLELDLSETGIDDNSLSLLKNTTSRVLFLSKTRITDAGIKHLQPMPLLTILDLSSTNISNKSLLSISSRKWLEMLMLENTKISDEGLIHLRKMKLLEYLDLSGTMLTDKGLQHLRHIRSLKSLRIRRTKVTQKGLTTLKTALPQLKIIRH